VTGRRLVYAQLTVACALFGGTWPAGKVAVEHVPPLTVSTARFALSAVLLWAWLRLRDGRVELPARSELRLVAALGFTGIAAYSVFFLVGLERAPAADGSIIVPGLIPVVTTLLAWRVFGERPTRAVALGLMVALVGLVVVVDPVGAVDSRRLTGDLILLGGPLCWAAYSILGRDAVARYGAARATLFATAVGALFLAPFSIGGWGKLLDAPLSAWLAILYLAPAATVLGFVLFYEGVRVIGPAKTASFTLLVPIFGVLSSVLILGEKLRVGLAVGGLVVLAGVWLVVRPQAAADSSATTLRSSATAAGSSE
jgi:drug/metabolite transporter (DMT)-like permease